MTIKIVADKDIVLTPTQYRKFKYEYSKAFTHYVGSIPTFEEWVKRKLSEKQR